jgi:ABC-type transporter Mla maintaining outer membrane lipid asymmetry ATPase subunit MlaF
MTVEENLAYPLIEHTHLTDAQIKKKIEDLLALVGMRGSENLYQLVNPVECKSVLA